MQQPSTRIATTIVSLCAFGLAWALYINTAAPTITTRFGGTDGGELAAAALSGGVAHPSGYPTYLALARLALSLAPGEPAGRLALFSAACAALAVAATTWLLCHTRSPHSTGSGPLIVAAAAVYGGLLLMLSPRMWSQAVIVEVYALHLLVLVLCTLFFVRWLDTTKSAFLLAATFALGIGLGNHLTLAALIPAALLAWLVAPHRPPLNVRLSVLTVATLLAGLSVYALLPIFAARSAVPSWGDLTTVRGFWAHVSGTEYQYLVGVVPWRQRAGRIGFAARDLLAQPGLVGLIFAVVGGISYGWQARRALMVWTATVAGISLLFAVSYGGADGTVYLLPWTWTWCIWAAWGLQALLIQSRWLVRFGLVLLAGASLIAMFATQFRQLDLHADTTERDRIVRVLEQLPPRAILTSDNDALTFGVWYAQEALHIRTDALVIDLRLLTQSWYEQQLRRLLNVPAQTSLCHEIRTTQRSVYTLNPAGTPVPSHDFCAN